MAGLVSSRDSLGAAQRPCGLGRRAMTMDVPWAITPEKVAAAVQRIASLARPRQVILFGSVVRGETTKDSDVDTLVVIEDETVSPRQESVRIRRELADISMPMDILVVSERRLAELVHAPGLIYREALRHGMVVYAAAG